MSTLNHVCDSRFDYAKFTYRVGCNAQQDHFYELRRRVMEYLDQRGMPVAKYCKETLLTLKPGGPYTRVYIIELWGVSANFLFEREAREYLGWLERIDACIEDSALSEERIVDLSKELITSRRTSKNLNVFSSRSRSKAGGRSSGGTGFAIGSHKSDVRLSVYKRAHEKGKIEVQVTGAALDRALKEARRIWLEDQSVEAIDDLPFLIMDQLLFVMDKVLEATGVAGENPSVQTPLW